MNLNEQLIFMTVMVGSAECFDNLKNVKTDDLHFENIDTKTVAIVGQTCRYVLPFNFETCTDISKRLNKIRLKQPKKVKQKPVEIPKKTAMITTKPVEIPKKTEINERLRLAKIYLKRQIA